MIGKGPFALFLTIAVLSTAIVAYDDCGTGCETKPPHTYLCVIDSDHEYHHMTVGELQCLNKCGAEDSSYPHIRVKRLIDNSEHRHTPVSIENVPYVVNILKKEKGHCVGTIMKPWAIVTAAHCVENFNVSHIIILSGTVSRLNLNSGTQHRIRQVITHADYNDDGFEDDLSMLLISPHIDFQRSPNKEIQIYNGNSSAIPAGHPGLITGWGSIGIAVTCGWRNRTKYAYPEEVRSITVPLIDLQECRIRCKNRRISEKNICTFDATGQKRCSHGDSGSPLVVDGHLVGIATAIKGAGCPDVFMNVAHPDYKDWVTRHSAVPAQ